MSSYADVASHAPQSSNGHEPQPNPSLLEGRNSSNSSNAHPDVNSSKVGTVPAGSDLDNLDTETHHQAQEARKQAEKKLNEAKKEAKSVAKKIRESTSQASSTASSYLSEFLSKPKLWVSSLGLVNSILLGGLGFFAYTRRDQIRNADRRLLTAGVVGVLALLGGQGFFATDKALKQTKSEKPKSK